MEDNSKTSQRLSNKIILVTGGASGIGEGITKYLSSQGAFLYICDINQEIGQNAQIEGRIKFIKCDTSNDQEVESMIRQIAQEKGRLDCVVNCAGIGGAELVATEKSMHSRELFDRIYKVNLYGVFNVSRFAAKLMIDKMNDKATCNGNIIHISSVAGYEGQKGQTAYSASKGALIGMTLPMARDLGKYKIRVNSIAPGIIETPMIKGFRDTRIGKGILENTPIKTFGSPVHIALAVEAIILNDFINGSTIRVDGGTRLPHF
jgi:NAD(P)-dependent dehydrogenase (short-subunit alcohol dehydrogenase family)